jgi:hypothetical protein
VLTVAHNIFSFESGKEHQKIRFYPGQHGALGKHYEVRRHYFPEQFKASNSPANDYALLQLSEEVDEKEFVKLSDDCERISQQK